MKNTLDNKFFHLKRDMLQVEIGKSLVFSSSNVEKDNCPCFYVNNPCVYVKLKSFQQREFDTGVSPFLIKEIGT